MKTGIALFVYNRPEHTRQVLDGLKKNNIKKLYIFADGLKKAEDRDRWYETRKLIDNIDWCETEVIRSIDNKGLAKSIINGVNYILDKYERIIVLEDDCVPSENFISYMEKCFKRYENDEKVMTVGGYSWPFDYPEDYGYDIYFLHRLSSWGWGTWRRAWNNFKVDYEILRRINKSDKLKRILELAGEDLIETLKNQIEGKADSWAVFWALNIIENEGVCISPVKSLIKNVGLDGTGVHCDSAFTAIYDTKIDLMDISTMKFPNGIHLNYKINEGFQRFIARKDFIDRHKIYSSMLEKWVENLQKCKRITSFFNKTDTIAIYGAGTMGLKICSEIVGQVDIKCFIDNNCSKENIKGIPVVEVDKFCNEFNTKYIIVTPVYDFENIKENLLKKQIKAEIISLKYIIDSI